ncbi:MAG: CPBP family intramembrane metalloprotease, partial [Paracoccaceae bacterium]|nr:CPBP family intramembrane metalloprotease [Paracoccaceae bacterium]
GEFAEGDTPRGALLLLFSFVCMALGPIALARPLHLRSWLGFFGPSHAALSDFLKVFRALAILTAVLWLALPQSFELRPGMPVGEWLRLLPLTVLAVLAQTASEELAFRGYLQSQLAARFRSPLVWIVVPSALFAYGHYAPDATSGNALLFVAIAFAFAVAAADLTARTGTLGAAIAFHLANNLIAVAVTALPGTLSGVALYLYPFEASDVAAVPPLVALDLGVIGLSWLAARLALRL